jgi:tetratricopeptide (TPR) repeat protein
VQAGQPVSTVPKKPTPAPEITLDELELTMRRPVVKLQPAAPTQPATVSRSRPAASAASAASENNLSYKERLRKGYHHQLAGDYDEAMQEYRVIIRNAPELLSEVVSNMRALLKLAPRYAPGYRVLGDAYMRQGEYLQAMEAYNKALMMAKKGQAQGQVQGLR